MAFIELWNRYTLSLCYDGVMPMDALCAYFRAKGNKADGRDTGHR